MHITIIILNGILWIVHFRAYKRPGHRSKPRGTHIIYVRDIEYMEIMTAYVGQSAV